MDRQATSLLAPQPALETAFARTSGRLFERVAASLRAAIRDERFPPGATLPAERPLAARLGVSRITVVTAYERLRSEGLIERRRGSGTRVVRRPPGAEPWVGSGVHRLMGHGAIPSEYGTLLDRPVGFTMAALPGADPILEAARATVADELPRLLGEFGYAPHGHLPLREALAARHTAEGLPTRPDQILVTSGAQQALSLVVSLLSGAATTAVVEDPTYTGILDALRAVGATPVGIPVDAAGAQDVAIERLVPRIAPRFIYLIASYHNPTGAVLSAARAERICRVAARYGIPIIDDRTLADLGWADQERPPMLATMSDGPIITVASVSKVMWGGLRVGWIRAETSLIDRLARLKLAVDNGGSVISQAIAAAALPRLDELIAQRHREARERYAALAQALAAELPEWRWSMPRGGLSIWLRAPGLDAAPFADLAYHHGAIVVPGPVFSADGHHSDRLRLTFGDEPARIAQGVSALARAWNDDRVPRADADRDPGGRPWSANPARATGTRKLASTISEVATRH